MIFAMGFPAWTQDRILYAVVLALLFVGLYLFASIGIKKMHPPLYKVLMPNGRRFVYVYALFCLIIVAISQIIANIHMFLGR